MTVRDLASSSSDRRGVVGLLVLLFAITYLDRVRISVAGPRMQEDRGINPIGWGWVTGMFTLAYCLFEIPTGMMGDRSGKAARDRRHGSRLRLAQDAGALRTRIRRNALGLVRLRLGGAD